MNHFRYLPGFQKILLLLILSQVTLFSAYAQGSSKNKDEMIPDMKTYGFIENKGQVHDQSYHPNQEVKYLLLNKGMNVQLKANSFSYDTYITEPVSQKSLASQSKTDKFKALDPIKYTFHRIDISLPGCNPSPEIIAEDRSSDYTLYYTSNTPGGVAVHSYQRVTYKNIYDHIDLIFTASKRHPEKGFEYFFVVRPGGNASAIQLHYSGATSSIKNQKIQILLEQGTINEQIPESYLSGAGTISYRQPVSDKEKINIRYKTIAENNYSFLVPVYDHSKTLIIDPTPDLVWGTYYGGDLTDVGYAITIDKAGDLIFGGSTNTNTNMATAGAYQTTYAGNSDGIIGKFHANGNRVWVSYYGSDQSEDIYTVATDADNNIFFGGTSDSDNGIATPGSQQTVKGYGRDGLIAKFNSSGSRLWSTYYGGEEVDYVTAIKVDASGDVIVAGWTNSTTGIATPGSYQPNYAGGVLGDADDAFLAKFSTDGVRKWATYYGGPSFDRFYGMDIDGSGNICATGVTSSTTGIVSPGAFQSSFGGGNDDAFIVKFDNNGNRTWATYYGASGEDYAECIAVDHNDNIIIGGPTTSSSGIATAGSFQPVFGGNTRDGFVAKFDPAGSRTWATYYGGNGEEYVLALTCDTNDNILITGWTFSTTGISTANSYQPTGGGLSAIWTTFVVKLNSNSVRQWGTYYGRGGAYGQGIGYGIVTDASGNVFVTGATSFPDNIATCNAIQPSLSNNFDIFLAEFSEILTPAPSISISSNPDTTICAGTAVTFTALAINAGTNPSYQWKVNGTSVGTNNTAYTSSSLVNGDIISCQLTTSNSACGASIIANSNNIKVSVTAAVTPVITINSSSTVICSGNSVTFTAAATNGGSSPVYQWYNNSVPVGSNNPIFTSASLSNGDIVSCMLTSSITCSTSATAVSNSIPVTVNTITLPVVTIAASPDTVCPGDVVTFTGTVTNALATSNFQWSVNDINMGSNNAVFSTSDLINGDLIHCILTGTVTGCPDEISVSSDTVSVFVKEAPIVNVFTADTSIFYGDSVQLSASVSGNVSGFEWSPPNGLNNSGILNPVASPSETTLYVLAAMGDDGCNTEKQVKVTVFHDIFIPNAFTPNNDGKNDLFRIPPGISLSLNRFSIFDRWGNEVFHTTDVQKGWDGTYRGVALPVGVYIYIIDGNSSKGKVFLKGTVTLIR